MFLYFQLTCVPGESPGQGGRRERPVASGPVARRPNANATHAAALIGIDQSID